MATMERRHFQRIADILLDIGPGLGANDRVFIVEAFASDLAGTNARFDKEKFIDACWGR